MATIYEEATRRARMGRPPVPAAIRFWRFVERTETCWIWTGAMAPQGYGKFSSDARQCVGAHRYSWVLHYGPVPPGHYVSQSCGVRACVRPDHLYLRTRRIQPKLTAAQVQAIRALQGTLRQVDVARMFGITAPHVRAIWLRLTWHHLPETLPRRTALG